MKPLKYYIKKLYNEEWLAKVFFREKFSRCHGKQYFKDFRQTNRVCRQAEAAGFSLAEHNGRTTYMYVSGDVLLEISYVDFRGVLSLSMTVSINDFPWPEKKWTVLWDEDFPEYLEDVLRNYRNWIDEFKELLHQADIIRKQLAIGRTAVKVFLDNMLAETGWPYTLEYEDFTWVLEVKGMYHRAVTMKIPVDINIDRLAGIKERLQNLIDAGNAMGAVSMTVKNYGNKSDWKTK